MEADIEMHAFLGVGCRSEGKNKLTARFVWQKSGLSVPSHTTCFFTKQKPGSSPVIYKKTRLMTRP